MITEQELRDYITEETGWDLSLVTEIGDNIGDSLELLQLLQDIEDHYLVTLPIQVLNIKRLLNIINHQLGNNDDGKETIN